MRGVAQKPNQDAFLRELWELVEKYGWRHTMPEHTHTSPAFTRLEIRDLDCSFITRLTNDGTRMIRLGSYMSSPEVEIPEKEDETRN